MNREEVAQTLGYLKAHYTDAVIDAARIDAYLDIWGDLDPWEVMRAVRAHCAEAQPFFPRAGEIRQRVACTAVGAPGPESAWAEVLRAVGKYGTRGVPLPPPAGGYGPIAWSHDAVKRAVQGVGWQAICESENIGVERAHFLRQYEAATKTAVRAENVGRLEAASPIAALAGDVTKRLITGGGR